jgi:hypothetical protein
VEITSDVVNKILANQQVSISQEDLDKLKGISGVKFDLPLNDETFFEFVNLVGKQTLKNKSITFSGKRYKKSKAITIKEVTTGITKDFPNILSVVSYLEGINNKINRNTVTKYLNTGKHIKGYLFYDK